MGKLSRKEKVSILQLITAGLCLADVAILMFVFRFPEDLRMFIFQCVLTATAIISILFGLSTWFYNSNLKCHRRHIRIYSVVVLWIFCILLICSCLFFYMRYMGKPAFGHFEPEIFDSSDLFLVAVSAVVGIVTGVILIIINIFVTVTKLRNKSKKRVRIST